MSDHDPNGDDDFLSRGPYYRDDDSNPQSHLGYGRGDDIPVKLKPRMTQAYSFVEPQRVINVGERTVEPTVPMEAMEVLTVKDVVHRLIERNLQAWRALPERVRDRILERPQDFQLVSNTSRKEGDFDYNILYNGTVWRYDTIKLLWSLYDVVR